MSRYTVHQPGDRLLTTQPLFWVGGMCTSTLAANLRGAAVVVPDTPSDADMLRSIQRDGVTAISLWPAQIAKLWEQPEFGEAQKQLKAMSAQQLGLYGHADAAHTPNCLGMTETFGPHSMEFTGDPLPDDRVWSFGRGVGTVERAIVDPATGRHLPPGEPGEICLRGWSMMLGYHRKARDEVFDADGWYHTGDLGSLSEDGHLFFTGRLGDMLKISGANVSPREVELVLIAEPEVAEAVVLGLPDPEQGDVLVAAVVLHVPGSVDEATLIGRLKRQLSSYKVPRRIVLLKNDEMPRTPSEKVRKPELRALMQERLA
jgi:acyl-CoA synthetase (AMP-forming)/AMP-acid ligase II